MIRLYAQHGEDRILSRIFKQISTVNRVAVEFGALDGFHASNTAYFRICRGWQTILFDQAPLAPDVHQALMTAENINAVFAAHLVPTVFDLLSIDIDGNDLWVWKALRYLPRVVIIEYNPRWASDESRTVVYDPLRLWDGTDYYGASVLALCVVGKDKGYDLVASTSSNLIFVEQGLLPAITPDQVSLQARRKRRDPLARMAVSYP